MTTKKHWAVLALLACSLVPIMAAKNIKTDNSTKLWYDAPASHWLEALPIGNSHLGGMVYGGVQDENIQLNEETFWSGGPCNNNSSKSMALLPEVRKLIFAGREEEAANIITKTSSQVPMVCAFCRWPTCIF